MKIGLDILGGDFAPEATIQGAILASKQLSKEQKIVLIGDQNIAKQQIEQAGENPAFFEYVHAPEIIGMGEHPTKAIAQKPNSSISRGFQLLKEGAIDSFASAGSTGAMLVGAVLSVKNIPGVIRPAIGTYVPKISGGYGFLLDVGAVSDCKPEMLSQFGLLGSLFAEHVAGMTAPNVALLNIGEEEEKGNTLTQASYPLLKQNQRIRFIGNIEGRNVFDDGVDVIVCDGFTGNVVLKMAESFYVMTQRKGLKDEFFDRFNYEIYGGTPILGVNAPVVIGHGISNPKAIETMIMLSKTMIESDIIEKIKSAFNE
ncbi:phosphate acyltransferase PlsX [Parapedobacter indicus]|uniref:Phosphate acyltransferase n=1 Tax=Parapedobacter indicus TaxID=1477437 RepID=A0A1I3M7P9_9SPHI|nr:phosphate acyltransferase PlsX [Parapedobacter indicus]PPL01253.1 phosphate:acyl-[acyl carrier protein] acyltransferase [Parapedobacter indicus]SFI92993.1 phosphate:acyl-[acyl carrier protein] acyltransferase [Parapedobacter indicus]